ncbi:methionine synthase [Verrucomicrobiota bacterium]|nr:methionine synthase [Verrucomicrobiota bacterium]
MDVPFEGVGLEDVGAGVEVGAVDIADDRRLGDDEQVVIALELARVVGEARTPVVGFLQLQLLDHGAHRAVEENDTLAEEGLEALPGRVQW